jgi:hypothetical protein
VRATVLARAPFDDLDLAIRRIVRERVDAPLECGDEVLWGADPEAAFAQLTVSLTTEKRGHCPRFE